MSYEEEYVGALDLMVVAQQEQQKAERSGAERMEAARDLVDQARLALAELAPPAVAIIGLRLAGSDKDWNGRPLTDDRESTAFAVLDRVGIPKLRATAIAASLVAAPAEAAPGSPGAAPPAGEDRGPEELPLHTVDAQIDEFLRGARAARDLAGGEPG